MTEPSCALCFADKYDEGGAAAAEEFDALGEVDDLGEGGVGAYEGAEFADDEEQEASALVQDEGAEALGAALDSCKASKDGAQWGCHG